MEKFHRLKREEQTKVAMDFVTDENSFIEFIKSSVIASYEGDRILSNKIFLRVSYKKEIFDKILDKMEVSVAKNFKKIYIEKYIELLEKYEEKFGKRNNSVFMFEKIINFSWTQIFSGIENIKKMPIEERRKIASRYLYDDFFHETIEQILIYWFMFYAGNISDYSINHCMKQEYFTYFTVMEIDYERFRERSTKACKT